MFSETGTSFFVVIIDVLSGTGSGETLILRQRNLSKQCLLRFLCLNIKIFYHVCCEAFQEFAIPNWTMQSFFP